MTWDEDAKSYNPEPFYGTKSFKPHRWDEDAKGYEDEIEEMENRKKLNMGKAQMVAERYKEQDLRD